MKEQNNNKKIFGVPSLDNALKEGKTEINVSSKGVLLKEDNSFFLNLLIDTYNNEAEMTLIRNSNDYMNQAPVLTWLLLKYKEIKENNMDKILSSPDSKSLRVAIGAFWGMVMKEKYNMSKDSKQTIAHPEKVFNFKTASRYK